MQDSMPEELRGVKRKKKRPLARPFPPFTLLTMLCYTPTHFATYCGR